MLTNAQQEFAQMLGHELVQLWLQRDKQEEPDTNADYQPKKSQTQKQQEKISRNRNKPRSE